MIFVGKTRSHPFRTPAPQRATPNGVNLLAAPLTTATQHIWLDQEGIFTLPLYRLAGLTSVANAEFSTKPFELPDLRTHRLWLNADVSWDRSNSAWDGGGCDESCAGYLMVEMLDAATGAVLRPKEGCAMQNVGGLDMTMEWKELPPGPRRETADGGGGSRGGGSAGQRVVLRFYLRAAVVYAFGVSPL